MNHADDESRLLAIRPQFPTLERSLHLVTHSLGAMPRRARALLNQFADEWERDSVEAWNAWLPRVAEIAASVGRVLGAEPGTVMLRENVSTIVAQVASALDYSKRPKIVLTALDFPSCQYVWREQVRYGAEVVVVPSHDGITIPLDELCAAIDERTCIVPMSHVQFRTSTLVDVAPVIRRAREVGALFFLDCYQSAGTVPLDLPAMGVDLACGGSVKWACGGPGLSYLYAAPRVLQQLRPAATGWFAHEKPFAFAIDRIEYAQDAWRFATGTPPMAAFYGGWAGWQLLSELGVESIRRKSLRQTALLRGLVEERGWAVHTPRADKDRGGAVVFDPGPRAQQAVKALGARRVFCDYRPPDPAVGGGRVSGIRASAHHYTTDEELRRFVEELAGELRG
jgi:kynureninase